MIHSPSLVKSNKSIPRLQMKNAPSSSANLKPTSISQFEDNEDNFQKQSFLKSSRNLNIIKIFSIEPDGSLVLSTTSLEEFKQTAFQLHKIKKLEVEFPGESKACNSVMKEILEKVSGLTFLEGLSLSFANLEESCESGFQALYAVFANCIRIRDLRIAFLSCNHTLSHDAALVFEKSLYKLISLETLTLEFSENPCMENDFLSPILSTLSKLSKLTKLNLRVHDCPGLTDYAFAGFAKVGAKLQKLTSLNLELSFIPLLETKGMKYITFALVSMRSLKNLRLSFQSLPGLDDLCIVTFSKELHGFQQVKALSLEFIACNNLGIQGFYALRDFLTNFDQLKKLNVTVFNMPIVMHSMAAVCGAVAVYTGLQELNLDLSYSAYAGQKALIILKDTLSAISRLKSIRFALDGWRDTLTDQGMVLLKDSLRELRYIRSFDLSLAECSNVSDKGFEVFSSMLDYFVELENLRLNFNGCSDLTELGWEHILLGLLKLKGLNKFVIDITGCKKLVESFCQGLLQVIENNKNIVHLEIHACGTYEITDKGAGYLKDAVLFLNKPRFVKLGYNDNRVSVFKIEKLKLLLERRLKQTEVDVYGGFVHTEESYEGETEN